MKRGGIFEGREIRAKESPRWKDSMQSIDLVAPVFKKEQCNLAKVDRCDAERKWQVSNVAAGARSCRRPGSAHHDAGG
jgi:hypothetical protein